MAEYIDKWSVVNKLIDLENEFQQYKPFRGFEHAMYRKVCEAEIAIGKTPAADVVEVKHGRWIDGAENFTCGNHNAECSVCHCNVSWSGCDEDFNYCPNCGADMRVSEEEKLESHSKEDGE
jgi:hypothetical protein